MTVPIVSHWKTATIKSGGTVSDVVDLVEYFGSILILIPSITGATVTIALSDDGVTFYRLDKPDGGGDMTLPKSRAHRVHTCCARYLQLTSASSEGADRSILILGTN